MDPREFGLETTGFYTPADAILQMAVVGHAGEVLLHRKAEAIYRMTPRDVQDARHWTCCVRTVSMDDHRQRRLEESLTSQ